VLIERWYRPLFTAAIRPLSIAELDSAVSPDAVRGGRYPDRMMTLINR